MWTRVCAVALCALAVLVGGARAAAYTVDCNHEYTDCDTELKCTVYDIEIVSVKDIVPLFNISTGINPTMSEAQIEYLLMVSSKINEDEESLSNRKFIPTTTDSSTLPIRYTPKFQEIITNIPKDETTEAEQLSSATEPSPKPQPRLIDLNVDDLQKFANELHNQTKSDRGHKKITDLSDVNLDEEDDFPKTINGKIKPNMPDKFYKNLQVPFNPLVQIDGMEEVAEAITCKENGVEFKVGERMDRECEESCECMSNGVFECSPRCKHPYIRRGRKLNDPLCFESPVDDCCSIIACAGNTDIKSTAPDYCKYKNETHSLGVTWKVGCKQICTCEKNGVVSCKPRCNPLPQSDKCINVQDPSDECCEVQVCDVSQDAHEEYMDNTTSTAKSTTVGRKILNNKEVTTVGNDETILYERRTMRPLVLPEPIGSVTVLHNNSVQVNLMHINSSDDPIHLLLSDDGGATFKDVILKYDNLILNLDGGKEYILKTKETGTKFNFTITNVGDVNEVPDEEVNNFQKKTGCYEAGKFYNVGEEFQIGCTELCECIGQEKRDCVPLECPNHVGLELVSKGCVRWAPSPPAQWPNCCPRAAKCLSDGTCHYKGVAIPNWTEVPITLTGCEQRCFCENGDLECQEVCSPISPVPPQTLRCPPLHHPAAVNVSDEDCCKQWGCLPNASRKTIGSTFKTYNVAYIYDIPPKMNFVTPVVPISSQRNSPVLPIPPVTTESTNFYGHLNPVKNLPKYLKNAPTTVLHDNSKYMKKKLLKNDTYIKQDSSPLYNSPAAFIEPIQNSWQTVRDSKKKLLNFETIIESYKALKDTSENEDELNDESKKIVLSKSFNTTLEENTKSVEYIPTYSLNSDNLYTKMERLKPKTYTTTNNNDNERLKNENKMQGPWLKDYGQNHPLNKPIKTDTPFITKSSMTENLDYFEKKPHMLLTTKPTLKNEPIKSNSNFFYPVIYHNANGHQGKTIAPLSQLLKKTSNNKSTTLHQTYFSKSLGKQVTLMHNKNFMNLKSIGAHRKESEIHVLSKALNPYQTVLLRALPNARNDLSIKSFNRKSSSQLPEKTYSSLDLDHILSQMEMESEMNRNIQRSAKNVPEAGDILDEADHLNQVPDRAKSERPFLPTILPGITFPHETNNIHRTTNSLEPEIPLEPPGFADTNKKLSVLNIQSDSPTSIKLLFGLPPVLVGLRGSVDLRYTDKAEEDISLWNSQVFAPADEILTTPRLEFRLTGLKPSTAYKIRGKLYLQNLPFEPESDIKTTKTLDLPSITSEEEKLREIDSQLTVVEVNDTTAHVSWRHFTEDELQYIDGIQVRYRPVGTPIYLMTELLHHSRSTAELKDLRPSSRYEASLVLIPPPRSNVELHDPGRVEFTTAPYVDPYNWSVTVEVRAVGSEAAELTWRGVPAPAERWVRVYRAAHACQDNPRKENDAFKLAARDLPPVVTLTGLKSNTKCRVWLELFLTNGKVKTSNVLEIITKSLDSSEPIDNVIAGSATVDSRSTTRGDYYGALVVVGVVAALGALTSILLLLIVLRRHRPRSVPITPVPPSAPRESSLPPYDNPAYKLELQQETMDL